MYFMLRACGAVPTNTSESSHGVGSRNGWKGQSDRLHDVITHVVFSMNFLFRGVGVFVCGFVHARACVRACVCVCVCVCVMCDV